ncbi:MAG TPA: SurA N-terminal domain-containing protein [Steroidobacteraceae bacterium]|jgi:peptidyl-prolyl cis-trans isomerase D|nr:SurA N-terminal domain-containing protein [Steroidobacteraceae bacterium]
MLQNIRDKISGVVAIAFLGAIALVFIFWGAHGLVDFNAGPKTFAAKVDGDRIPIDQVQRAWQQRQSQLQQMLRGELPAEMVKSQQTMLLDQFVEEKLLKQRAERFGYRITDAELARQLMQRPEFQVDGKFSKDRYNALLAANGLTETGFEAQMQDGLLIDQLRNAVIESAFVAPYELDRRYAIEKQEREIDYALIPASDYAASTSVTDEQVKKWYDENKQNYMLPETVNLQYIELTREHAESGIEVTEQALKEYYEQVKDRFTTQEQRHGRHILITVGDGVDDAAARKKAEELTAKAKAGADFAQLAKENSKDAGSAQQGGDLGLATRDVFVGPFGDALFTMAAGEIRGPVKSEFGYHVIKLDEIQPGHVKSYDEAHAELEADYRKERAQNIFYDESQKLADTAFAALTELDSVAKQLNLPVKTVNGFTRAGGGEFGEEPSVIEAAFSDDVLERRQNSSLVTVGEDRALVLRVTDHKAAEARPLDTVSAQIREQLKSQRMREAAAAQGAFAMARLQKGEAWPAVTGALHLGAVGKRFMGRQDSIAPAAIVRAAFNAPTTEISEAKPYFGGVTTDDGNYAVYAVTHVRNADPSKEAAAERNNRRRRAEVQSGNGEFNAYVGEAERTTKIVKNDKLFE